MHDLIIASLAFSFVPLILSFFLPNWYLGDKQNAVEDGQTDGTGKVLESK